MNMIRFMAVFALGCLVMGCSSPAGNPSSEIEIKGKVVLPNGKTLDKGVVLFSPILGSGAAREEIAKIESGSFATKITPGKYRIAVDPPDQMGKARSTVPAQFTNPEKSGVELEITSSNPDLVITLK